jgi:hypothetical protein
MMALLLGPVWAQSGIVLDGVGDDWDPAWQVATDPLDVFLTDTGVHPHEAPTYARSGYDAVGLWAHYQTADDRWYFRIDVDGRAGDADSMVGTAGDPGVGTHGNDQGPLVVPPFTDGDGLGSSEAYKLGFQFEAGATGLTTELGPGAGILPGVLSTTGGNLGGQAIYSTTVPGVVEFGVDKVVLFPDGSAEDELWLSAQVGDNNDRVSDDQVPAVLVVALDGLAQCPAAPAVEGDEATFPVVYAIPAAAALGVSDVVLEVTVPPGTTFVSASAGGTEDNGVITWQLGDLAPGDGGQVDFTLLVETTTLIIDTEMWSAEGLRHLSSNECPVVQPTREPIPTPTTSPEGPGSSETPVVPEPATVTLMLTAMGGLASYVVWQVRSRREG